MNVGYMCPMTAVQGTEFQAITDWVYEPRFDQFGRVLMGRAISAKSDHRLGIKVLRLLDLAYK